MTRKEIMEKINEIAKVEMHDKTAFKELTSEQQTLSETGIDSFDFIMLYMKLGEYFNIENKVFKDELPDGDPILETVINFLEKNANIAA